MARYTLRQLAYFRAVAEHGGIAQAARALNISQPSISQALKKLEDILGLALFDRHHARGLELTLQGRDFLRRVIELEAKAEELERDARALAMGETGEIRLGVFWTLSPFYGPALLKLFGHSHPEAVVSHREMPLTDLAAALASGEIDIALTYDQGADLDGFAQVELAMLRPVVVLPADHPLAARGTIRFADLDGEPYVMLEGSGSRRYFEDLLADAGISPAISYTSSSMEAVRSAVAAGFGYTLLAVRPPSPVTYGGGHVAPVELADPIRPLRVILAFRPAADRGILRRFIRTASGFVPPRGPFQKP